MKQKKKATKEKRGCRAYIVLGSHIAKQWQSRCKERKQGTCCKDCLKVVECENPCSKLSNCYHSTTKTFAFDFFNCDYYLTEVEAVLRRMGTDDERGVKE